MARKQAPGFTGSQRIKVFLLGFRWLALVLGLILMATNAGTSLAPSPGILRGIGAAVVVMLVIYSVGASFFLLKLSDKPSNLYVLLVLDVGFGCFLTLFYGLDFFLLAYAVPVLEAAYFFGAFPALLAAIFVGCYYAPAVGIQILKGMQNGQTLRLWGLISLTDTATLRVEMLGAYVVVGLILGWVVAAIRGDDAESEESRKRSHDEKSILIEEIHSSKKDFNELFDELDKRQTALIRTQEELQEARDELEGTLKKLHECRHQFQAAQQLTQRKETQLTTTHKREMEETRKELEEVQATLDRSNQVLDTLMAVNASLHRDQAVMNIIEAMMKLVPSQTCLLYSVETTEGREELYPDGGASPYLEYMRNYSIKLGDGAVGWVGQHREPIRIDKEQAVVEGQEISTLFSYEKSAIITPLEFDGRLLGVLYLGRAPASSFSQEDFDVAVQFSHLVSPTFNNALVYQRTLSVGIFDEVTGLYNALYFDERLTEEVKRARRYKFALSLILLDIDHFTKFNESYGHAEGNQVLKDVAAILKEHTRETDVLSRLENDEFAVLLVESEKSNAILIGERIRMALEMRYLGRQARNRVHVTVSGGVASFPAEADSRELLVDKAAAALERARAKEGNQLLY